MKKIISILLVVCLVFSLAACRRKKKDQQTDSTPVNNTQSSANIEPITENTEMVAVSVPAVTEDTLAGDNTVVFQYTYQHMSLMLNKPDVADKIILDFLNRVDSTKESADSIAAMAKTAYNGSKNWVPYLYHITYSPTRIDHSVLSLFGNNVVFSGAPHPERTCVSASYDLQTGDVLTLASIMDKNATVDSFRNLVFDGLTELAEGDHLYENYKDTVKQRFDGDASQDEAWYFTQTGLCFYFAPYEIAPYSSGVITVEIPYEKLTGIIHEDYHPEKRSTPRGGIQITPFDNTNVNNFAHIAEIVTNKSGTMYMAQTDGYVQDVRIILNDTAGNYTVFAANSLIQGNGIMVQTDDTTRQKMKLTYKSGSETVNATIG